MARIVLFVVLVSLWGLNRLRKYLKSKKANEALEVITRLWSEEKVTFEGDSIQVHEATISPRPVQQPLPLWVGGSAAKAVERTARWGTGWQAGIETHRVIG